MIDVKNLSKSFGDNLVLDDISEHIYPGEKVVIIGPSGSGKSTFLRCLNLLENPTAGTISFDGTVITDPKADYAALQAAAKKASAVTGTLTHILEGLPTDCSICALKDICDEVEGMKELHFGVGDKSGKH